eukprot:COSAG01_NODE_1136_length_11548_cov_30.375404_9_plen_51_part_00
MLPFSQVPSPSITCAGEPYITATLGLSPAALGRVRACLPNALLIESSLQA